MHFITHRSRYSYWSSSKLSKTIRKRFGLENPKWNTMEGWDEHEEFCKKKSPKIHWLTDTGLNKLQNIWLFIPDLIWTIRTANTWTFLRNLWLFRKALWRFKAYDYSGLLMLMETATNDMHRCHRDHGHLMRSEQTARELLIVSTLCKRIRESKYTDEVQGYKNEGDSLFGGKFYQVPNTLPSIKYKQFYRMRERVKQNDLELLCKILNKKLLTFWD